MIYKQFSNSLKYIFFSSLCEKGLLFIALETFLKLSCNFKMSKYIYIFFDHPLMAKLQAPKAPQIRRAPGPVSLAPVATHVVVRKGCTDVYRGSCGSWASDEAEKEHCHIVQRLRKFPPSWCVVLSSEPVSKKRALIVSDSNGRNACVILHVSLLWYFVVTLSSRLRKVTWPSSAAFTLQPARVPLRFHLGWCKDPTFEAQAPCSMELLRDRM